MPGGPGGVKTFSQPKSAPTIMIRPAGINLECNGRRPSSPISAFMIEAGMRQPFRCRQGLRSVQPKPNSLRPAAASKRAHSKQLHNQGNRFENYSVRPYGSMDRIDSADALLSFLSRRIIYSDFDSMANKFEGKCQRL